MFVAIYNLHLTNTWPTQPTHVGDVVIEDPLEILRILGIDRSHVVVVYLDAEQVLVEGSRETHIHKLTVVHGQPQDSAGESENENITLTTYF